MPRGGFRREVGRTSMGRHNAMNDLIIWSNDVLTGDDEDNGGRDSNAGT